MDAGRIVVDCLTKNADVEEITIILESHLGHGTVLDSDKRTTFSPDKSRLLLMLASKSGRSIRSTIKTQVPYI